MKVSDLPANRSQRWRSHAFQNACCLLLRDYGLSDVRPASKDEAGDLAGLPGWVLTARNHQNLEPSTSIDEVVRATRSAPGAPVPAAILARRSHALEESYVLLRLADFADVVARLADAPGAPLSARVRSRPVEQPATSDDRTGPPVSGTTSTSGTASGRRGTVARPDEQ